MSERPQRDRLLQMLGQMEDPVFPKKALSEVMYTALETHVIHDDAPFDDLITLYKVLKLSQTITEEEIAEIRM